MTLIRLVIFALVLVCPLAAYAVNVSMSSVIQITGAPARSMWKIECGPSTGVYTSFSKIVAMEAGTNRISVADIFPTNGTYFCRSSFLQQFGQGSFAAEVQYVVSSPALSTPSETIIP